MKKILTFIITISLALSTITTAFAVTDDSEILGISQISEEVNSENHLYHTHPNTTFIDSENYSYTIYNEPTTIMAYNGNKVGVTIPKKSILLEGIYKIENHIKNNSLVIPDNINDMPVVYVRGNNFVIDSETVNTIIIPESVKLIEDFALNNYTLNLGNTDCSFYIMESSNSIFQRDINIEVSDDNPAYCSIDGVLYNKDMTTLMFCPKDKTELVIPDTVTTIGPWAFSNCNIENIVIPDSVITIEKYAFCNSKLKNITFGNSVINIFDDAFNNCDNLENVIIPNSVKNIASGAFYECENLKSVVLGNSVENIGASAFGDCTSLESINIPDSVKCICLRAFLGSTSLTELTIPKSVKYVYHCAFDRNTTVYGYSNSWAEKIANQMNVNFISIGEITDTVDTPDDSGRYRYETLWWQNPYYGPYSDSDLKIHQSEEILYLGINHYVNPWKAYEPGRYSPEDFENWRKQQRYTSGTMQLMNAGSYDNISEYGKRSWINLDNYQNYGWTYDEFINFNPCYHDPCEYYLFNTKYIFDPATDILGDARSSMGYLSQYGSYMSPSDHDTHDQDGNDNYWIPVYEYKVPITDDDPDLCEEFGHNYCIFDHFSEDGKKATIACKHDSSHTIEVDTERHENWLGDGPFTCANTWKTEVYYTVPDTETGIKFDVHSKTFIEDQTVDHIYQVESWNLNSKSSSNRNWAYENGSTATLKCTMNCGHTVEVPVKITEKTKSFPRGYDANGNIIPGKWVDVTLTAEYNGKVYESTSFYTRCLKYKFIKFSEDGSEAVFEEIVDENNHAPEQLILYTVKTSTIVKEPTSTESGEQLDLYTVELDGETYQTSKIVEIPKLSTDTIIDSDIINSDTDTSIDTNSDADFNDSDTDVNDSNTDTENIDKPTIDTIDTIDTPDISDTDSSDDNNSDTDKSDIDESDTDIEPILLGLIGDIDGDYTVNSKDALIVLRASVGLERLNNTQLILADVDNSKSITSSDSLDILRYSVRLKDIHSIINTPIYLDDINSGI